MLFLITNRKLVKNKTFLSVIEDSAAGGADAIILREKDLDHHELFKIAKKIKEVTKDKKNLLIINGNLPVAKAVAADGYHIGFHDFMKEKPDWYKLLGVSVHSLEEAVLAEKNGASYLLAGHVFETDCKKGLEPRGIGFIEEIKKHVKIPVIALGGINLKNMKEVFSVGADGIAVMSSIMASDDPYKTTREYKNEF